MKKKLSVAFAVFRIVYLPVLILCAYLFSDRIIGLTAYFPECDFHKATGLLCPACGNTRSVLALLRGDFLASIRNNATILFLALVVVLLYIEDVFRVFHKKIHLIPRSNVLLFTIVGAFLIYYVLRNIFPEIAPL